MSSPAVPAERGQMTLMEHLGELRDRIVRSLIALIIGLAIAFPFSSTMVD